MNLESNKVQYRHRIHHFFWMLCLSGIVTVVRIFTVVCAFRFYKSDRKSRVGFGPTSIKKNNSKI